MRARVIGEWSLIWTNVFERDPSCNEVALRLSGHVYGIRMRTLFTSRDKIDSVDPKTELLIYDRLFKEFNEKAVISSLHRLHLLTKFDYVYIMENGRVVDEGIFAELRKESAIFQELWRHQEDSMNGTFQA